MEVLNIIYGEEMLKDVNALRCCLNNILSRRELGLEYVVRISKDIYKFKFSDKSEKTINFVYLGKFNRNLTEKKLSVIKGDLFEFKDIEIKNIRDFMSNVIGFEKDVIYYQYYNDPENISEIKLVSNKDYLTVLSGNKHKEYSSFYKMLFEKESPEVIKKEKIENLKSKIVNLESELNKCKELLGKLEN